MKVGGEHQKFLGLTLVNALKPKAEEKLVTQAETPEYLASSGKRMIRPS